MKTTWLCTIALLLATGCGKQIKEQGQFIAKVKDIKLDGMRDYGTGGDISYDGITLAVKNIGGTNVQIIQVWQQKGEKTVPLDRGKVFTFDFATPLRNDKDTQLFTGKLKNIRIQDTSLFETGKQ